jgi:amino acid permease
VALSSIGTVVFAFGANAQLIPVTVEMKDNRFSNVAKATNIATTISMFSYLVCGVSGYLTFREKTGFV